MVDKQSCIIISIVLTIGISLAALDIAWTIWGPCSADVMLMLDDSGSVSDSNFEKVKGFVRKLANDESIKDQMDKENVQFGVATFSTCPKWMAQKGDACEVSERSSLKYVSNSYSMKTTLKTYQRCSTYSKNCITDIIKALEFVDNQMMRSARDNSDKILLFMTDGESLDSNGNTQELSTIRKHADKLKEEGVKIYVIAVGDKVDDNEIETISSSECTATEKGKTCKNSDKFIIKVDDFEGLDSVISELAEQVCEHQYWMAAIPIGVAILFVVIKVLLDRREAKKLDRDAKELETFTATGMTSGRQV